MAWDAHEAQQIGALQQGMRQSVENDREIFRKIDELNNRIMARDTTLMERFERIEQSLSFARGGWRGVTLVFTVILALGTAFGWIIHRIFP